MAVQRDVGRVQVQHDPLRHDGMRFDVEIAEQSVDGFGRAGDFVITAGAAHQL
jgi:hypothetical protein